MRRRAADPRRPGARRRVVVAAALVALGMLGCRREEADPARAARSASLERGPATLTVRCAPGVLEPGERLHVEIEIDAPAALIATVDPPPEDTEPFAVRAIEPLLDVPGGERRRWRTAWSLDTFATGELHPPTVVARLRPAAAPDSGDGSDASELAPLELAPPAVTVRSVLAEGESAPRDLKDALPLSGLHPAWWAGAALGVASLAALAVLAARRRAHGRPASPPPPAHEVALVALAAIRAERLPERGAFEPFYRATSDVVRAYVEARYGLDAPHRSTEEFLRDARHAAALDVAHRELLAGFLRRADLVKFARAVPTAAECDEALAAAERFVRDTVPMREEVRP